LHITNSWHRSSGGIATFYNALIDESNRRGHEIRLVVPAESDRVEEVAQFARIYHVEAPSSLFNSKYRTIYPSQFLAPGSKLQRILSSERPDLVEICDKYTLNYLGALLRLRLLPDLDFRPVVVGLSCERMDDNFGSYIGSVPLAAKFCAAYMRWIYFPFYDHHIANSQYTAAELRNASEGQLVPRGTWVRPMGVDLCHLSPRRKSREMRRRLLQNFGAEEDATLLLYVGRLAPEKNLPLLFELLAHVGGTSKRDVRLLMVGDGIERERWETECATNAPGHVLFLGHIKDRNVLADLYANSDVFVHPNPREPFGIAPLEAMASGLPLVAPNVGGVTTYANNENAWTVEPTAESFAAAIDEILQDEPLRNRKTQNALATAAQYGWETVTASFLDLYQELNRLTRCAGEPLSSPSFISTRASGGRAIFYHGLSQSASKLFAVVAKCLSGAKPEQRRRPHLPVVKSPEAGS
jgi:alpha-1,6-mannosyltransferase